MAGQILNAGQLAQLRTLHERALPNTATILRRTLTSDGQGGQTQSYASVGTTICRLAFFGGNRPVMPDTEQSGKIEPKERWIVTLPYGADALETDRLTINGVTYEIVSALDRRSHETARRLLVKRV